MNASTAHPATTPAVQTSAEHMPPVHTSAMQASAVQSTGTVLRLLDLDEPLTSGPQAAALQGDTSGDTSGHALADQTRDAAAARSGSSDLGVAAPLDTPVQPAAVRARAFLLAPRDQIDALGRIDGAGRDTLALLDEISQSTRRLSELNQGLVPLIDRFREPGQAHKWWRWFTGNELQRELSFGNVCREIEACAEGGVEETKTMQRLIRALIDDRARIERELALLERDIELGELLLSQKYARLRAATGEPEEIWQRLSRRIGNLQAIATALQLTQAQYGVAIEHSRTVADRFDEIKTLLMPIWYQRMGFKLFARRLAQTSHDATSGHAARNPQDPRKGTP